MPVSVYICPTVHLASGWPRATGKRKAGSMMSSLVQRLSFLLACSCTALLSGSTMLLKRTGYISSPRSGWFIEGSVTAIYKWAKLATICANVKPAH